MKNIKPPQPMIDVEAQTTRHFARQQAAQAWCTAKTSHLEMIPELAEAFADIIVHVIENMKKNFERKLSLIGLEKKDET